MLTLVSFLFRFHFVSFRFVFVDFVSFRFVFVDFVSFRFVFVDFVFVDFVSFSLISFRFVSFRFRFVSFRFYFVSHFIGTPSDIRCLSMRINTTCKFHVFYILITRKFCMPPRRRVRGILIYSCPSVRPSGYRYMVCPAISSYSFGATALIFCMMFIHIMEVWMSTGI